jgi:signal transduction histidine kinase
MTRQDPFASRQDERGRGTRSSHAVPGDQATSLRASILAAAIIAAASVGGTGFVLAGHASDDVVRAVLGAVAGGAVLILIVVLVAARSATRQMSHQLSTALAVAQHGQAEVQQLAERALRGEHSASPAQPSYAHAVGDDQFQSLLRALEETRYLAGQAILRVVSQAQGSRSDQRVEIFVNLARRMQSLVHREIELLDDLEAKVEDPDLLKGLFTVDHLATRMRRQSESLAVLGGSTSRRQWTRQVTMHEVLRAAIAEVEQYSRVKVAPPVEGVLRGDAVSDVIHLIAELVENATKFSAPRTQTLLRAQRVAAGLAIEVEDRGLGMLPSDQQRMNAVLADPGQVDIDELLHDGRIGLYVVSTLARRHGIRVQLQGNIFGGTQAVIVLPRTLVETGPHDQADDEEPARGLVAASAPAIAPPPAVERPPASFAPAAFAGPAVRPMNADSLVAPAFTDPVGEAVRQRAISPEGERPPLPKRQVQTHLAPQLRERGHEGKARYADQPPDDHMTGLMADFLRGVGRSEEEDPAGRD